MKTATVADLRNHFPRVAAWIADGQSVEITRRGRPVAHLVPVSEKAAEKKIEWPDFEARRRAIWGDRVFSAREIAGMDAFENEDPC